MVPNFNDLKLNQNVLVRLSDGSEKKGKVKGINEENGTGDIKVNVEYLAATREDFDLKDVWVEIKKEAKN